MNVKERQLNNLRIVQKLYDYVLDNPDLRFIQALWALGIINRKKDSFELEDRFYEEPEETLRKIKEILNEKLKTS